MRRKMSRLMGLLFRPGFLWGIDLPDGLSLRIRVQPSREKYFTCAVGQISGTDSGRPVPSRGAYARSPRTLGAGCGGRVDIARRAIQCGRQSRVVLTPDAGVKLAGDPAGDGGYQAGTPGRARNKP